MKQKTENVFYVIAFIILVLFSLFCSSCKKEEYYHHNDVPVSWKYDLSGIDTLQISIDGAGGWDILPGTYRRREASETINAWYGQKYHIYAIHGHKLTLKFEGTTLQENTIYNDKVISK